jgi:hypothetical protein
LFSNSNRQISIGGFYLPRRGRAGNKREKHNEAREVRKIYNVGIGVVRLRRARDKIVPAGLVRGVAEQIRDAVQFKAYCYIKLRKSGGERLMDGDKRRRLPWSAAHGRRNIAMHGRYGNDFDG